MNGAQFTDRANKALLDANDLAEQYAHTQILPLHLAVSLLNPPAGNLDDEEQQTDSSSVPLFKQVIERAHGDPQLLERSLMKLLVRQPSHERTLIVDDDPQNRKMQIAKLEAAGVLVAPTNADAAALALACLRSGQ